VPSRAAAQENEPEQQRDRAGGSAHSPRSHLVFIPEPRATTHQIQNQEKSRHREQNDVDCG
jgi:hypothetical protein